MKYYYLIFLWIFGAYQAKADRTKFETISREDGLSHSTVNAIVQDHSGYMWFGTQDGLVRYDGYQFKIFRPVKGDRQSLHDSWINSIYVDSKNRLWVRFDGGGVSVYDPDVSFFKNLVASPDTPGGLSNDMGPTNRVVENEYATCETGDGSVWLATRYGLNRVDADFQATQYMKGEASTGGLTSNYISTLFYDQSLNHLHIGTDQGLNIIDLNTNKIYQYRDEFLGAHIRIIKKDQFNTYWIGSKESGLFRFQLSSKMEVIENKRILARDHLALTDRDLNVYDILIAHNSDVWLAMDDGLYQLDYRGNLIKNHMKGYSVPTATKVLQDGQGDIWASSTSLQTGLIHIDSESGKFTEYNQKDSKHHGYTTNYIQSMFFDSSGILWIGTTKGGVIKNNVHLPPFEAFNENYFEYKGKTDSEVYSIYKHDDKILVGTKHRLYQFKEDFKIDKVIDLKQEGSRFASNIVGVLTPDEDKIWVGYFRGKISTLDLKSRKFTHYDHHDPNDPECFPAWSLRDICVAKDGTVYFAPISGGLIYQKKGSKIFQNLEDEFSDIDLHFGGVLTVVEDHLGQILVGTTNDGLFIYRPNNHSIKQVTKENSGISHNEIRSIHQDFMGTTWLGTRFGITELNTNYEVVNTYFYKDGLPSNIVHGILEDQFGNLWMSTNNGISRFDIKGKKFSNFTESDGLTANEFNECAFYKDEDGMMYFGGFKGVTRFDPKAIQVDITEPEVHFTDLVVGQQHLLPKQKVGSHQIIERCIDKTAELQLPNQQNNFKLYLSTLSYNFPSKIQYRYRLKGYEEKWNLLRNGINHIDYSSLAPGSYLLEAQASNSDGVWSPKVRRLPIAILPPWYETFWFRSLSIGILFLVVFGGILIYIRNLKQRKQFLTATVASKTKDLKEVNEELQAQQSMVMEQNRVLQEQSNELELQKKNVELLGQMGRAITADVEFSHIFKNIFAAISKLMPVDELMLGERNKKTGRLDLWGIKTQEQDFSRDEIDPEENARLSAWVLAHEKNLLSNDLQATANELLKNPSGKYKLDDGPKSGIYVPIKGVKGKIRGVLVAISNKNGAYTNTHLQMMENIASYVSIALSNARAYEKIRIQSEQLLQVDQVKSDFFTNVSHEFRTPISLIVGPLEEVKKSKNLTMMEMQHLGIIERNAQMLLSLVEQIMELSRIDGGVMKLNLQQLNPGDHFENIRHSFSHLALQKNIQLIGRNHVQGLSCECDVNVLNKIIYNLLNNAIKYTPQGGEVIFEAKVWDQGIEFKISDSGFGIEDQELERVFDRFYRMSGHGNTPGFGIGLALVKELVDLLDGNINVESKLIQDHPDEHGTTFTVYIPLKLEKAPQKESKKVQRPPYEAKLKPSKSERADLMLKTKILVVEDNPDLRHFLVSQLQEEYHTLYAENGLEALSIIQKEHPQLVLSDIMMPKMGGIELCKKLREDINTSHIPIILITAKDADEDKITGLKAGASDYLIKPFKIDELFLKVGNILSKRVKLIEQFKSDVWVGIQEVGDGLSPQDQEFLANVKAIIEEEIENPDLDIDHFCHQLGVSRTWLYNKMKSLLDMSMNEFIRSCRMKQGAKLLIFEQMTVSQAAFAVGFNDPKYFTRCFKKEFGMSPKAYIQQSANA